MAATQGNIKQIEHEKKVIAAKNAAALKEAQGMADRLAQVEVQIERQVGEADKLFGSVTSRDIVEALAAKGVKIDTKKLQLKEAIKSIGFHSVEIKLGQGITSTIKVVVVPKQ
jgi:large subunit ribosomal protein L9